MDLQAQTALGPVTLSFGVQPELLNDILFQQPLPDNWIISLLDSSGAIVARTKGIEPRVSGDPDILLVPDLEAGNILAKQLTFLANADSAGIVLGARVPIVLTSRADSVRSTAIGRAV